MLNCDLEDSPAAQEGTLPQFFSDENSRQFQASNNSKKCKEQAGDSQNEND